MKEQKLAKTRQLQADKARKYYAIMKRWKELCRPEKMFSEDRLSYIKDERKWFAKMEVA